MNMQNDRCESLTEWAEGDEFIEKYVEEKRNKPELLMGNIILNMLNKSNN